MGEGKAGECVGGEDVGDGMVDDGDGNQKLWIKRLLDKM